jgi:hypothetical protein
MFELSVPVNRFLVPETMQNNCLCTAFAYVNEDDWVAGGRPVIYSDNGNIPHTRRSTEEGPFDFRVISGKPAGWRSATFRNNSAINNGTNIWFGVFCEYYWFPRFDWGARCFADEWWGSSGIPNTYPQSRWTEIFDFRLSMYFTYTSAQNHIRTLTQGVNLTDSRKLNAEYKRATTHTVRINAIPSGMRLFFLKLQEAVQGTDKLTFPVFYTRLLSVKITILEKPYVMRSFFRGLLDKVRIDSKEKNGWIISRKLNDVIFAADTASRGLMLFVRIVTGVFVRDYILSRFLKARSELVVKSVITRELFLESKL